jgi:hypothetical protein
MLTYLNLLQRLQLRLRGKKLVPSLNTFLDLNYDRVLITMYIIVLYEIIVSLWWYNRYKLGIYETYSWIH